MENFWKRCAAFLCALIVLAPLVCGVLPTVAMAAGSKEFPMPNDYFGTPKETDTVDNNPGYYYRASSYPEKKVEKYIKALKDAGVKMGNSETLKGGNIVTMGSFGEESCVYIGWRKNTKDMVVRLYQKGMDAFDDAQKTSASTTKKSAKGKTISTSKLKDGQVPDPGEFLNCELHEDMVQEDCLYRSCKFGMDNGGKEAAQEYVALVMACSNLELREVREQDYIRTSADKFYNYYFTYTGSKKVETLYDWEDYDMGHLAIAVHHHYATGQILLSIRIPLSFQFVEDKSHTSYKLVDYAGNKNSGSDSSSEKGSRINNTVQCGICHGTGDCVRCGGDGYLYSSASKKDNHRNCTSCHPNPGKCAACSGTGYLN